MDSCKARWLVALVLLTATAVLRAQNLRTEYELNIPHGPLKRVITQLGEQTQLFIRHVPSTTAEELIPVGPLLGRYTVDAALEELIGPLGFEYERVDEFTIVIFPPWNLGQTHTEQSSTEQPDSPTSLAAAVEQELAKSIAEPYHIAAYIIEEVEVTGTRIVSPTENPAPVRIITRKRLDELGVATLAEVMRFVTQQPFAYSDGYRPNGAQFAEIRGLGVDATLILINNRRVAPTATSVAVNAFDLNAIPLAAVERVEILAASAAAIYGADAMGGVINIVLKKKIAEPSLEMRYGAAGSGANERRVSLSMGRSGERFTGSLIFDYFDRSNLLGEARDRWRDQNYERFGGADRRSLNANPGNLTSATPLNLPGLASRFAAVPQDASGASTVDELAAGAGQRNYESPLRFWSVVPETRRTSLVGFAEHQLTSSLTAFGEVVHADRTSTSQFEPATIAGVIVPASNAFNPFGAPVVANYSLRGLGPREVHADLALTRAVAGVKGEWRAWDWELSLLGSDETAHVSARNNVDPVRLVAALASSDPERALNVFEPGAGGSQAVISSLRAAPVESRYRAQLAHTTGLLRGPVVETPAGAVEAALGFEWRKERLVAKESTALDRDRAVAGAFGELRVPLVSRAMEIPALDELSLSFAARFDDYGRDGDSFNPQYGVVWRPFSPVALRASYATSFRPPSLYELFAPRTQFPTQFPDVRRNNEVASFVVASGGNPNLRPTEAESLSAGFVFDSGGEGPLRVAATYWRTHVDHRITLTSIATLLANEAGFGDRVLRAPPTAADIAAGLPGALLMVDNSRGNFGRLETSGVDFEVSYSLDTSFARFTPSVTTTWVNDFISRDFPSAPVVDRVSIASPLGTIPRWKVIGSLAMSRDEFNVSATARYTPGYQDYVGLIASDRVVPSQTLIDLHASFDVGQITGSSSMWEGFVVAAGVQNLLDSEPRFSEANVMTGYDLSQGDLRQRFAYLTLSKKF